MLKFVAVIAVGVLVAYSRGGFGAEPAAGPLTDGASIVQGEPSDAANCAIAECLSATVLAWSAPSD